MPTVEVVVRDSVVRTRLNECIQDCLDTLQSCTDGLGMTSVEIIQPEYDKYSTGGISFSLPEISFRNVYCVFQVTRRTSFYWKKHKILLFAISEPEVVFSEEGNISLSDIVVFVKDENVRDVLIPKVNAFADFFKIPKIRLILETVQDDTPEQG